jgi:galactose mutarotase-like enzyme
MSENISEITLESESIKLTLLPDIGCKITKLEFLRYDFQWLWQDKHRPVRTTEHGGNYADFDISGFDECFPNIGLSPYPFDSKIKLYDHGEIWSLPWQIIQQENSILGQVNLLSMPLSFQRRVTLIDETIEFRYQVNNYGENNYWYMWSAHPLFRLPNQYRVIAPSGQKMYKEFGFGGRLGADGLDGYQDHLKELTWPFVQSDSNETIDLTYVIPDLRVTDKIAMETLGAQEIVLANDDLGAGLKFEFSDEISHVGICSNLTAWPPGDYPATWIAIEPMIGISDRLDENVNMGSAREIAPNTPHTWSFTIKLVDLDKA